MSKIENQLVNVDIATFGRKGANMVCYMIRHGQTTAVGRGRYCNVARESVISVITIVYFIANYEQKIKIKNTY